MTPTIAKSEQATLSPETKGRRSGVRPRVVMFDLLPTVPYYTGCLSAALKRNTDVEIVLASATYAHDNKCFERMGLENSSGIVDFAYRSQAVMVRRAFKLTEYLLNLALLSRKGSNRGTDIIHVQFTPLIEQKLPFELWFLKATRDRGIKLVYTVHNVLPHEGGEQLRARYGELYSVMDQLICHDHAAKQRMIDEFHIDAERITVIPHGPLFGPDDRRSTTSDREFARAKTGLPLDECVVLWQGIIRPYKGLTMLLSAWQAAKQAGSRGILAIVGTGDETVLREIRRQVRSLGIDSSVHLDLRFVSIEELAAYHEAADVFVYPYNSITTSGALATGLGYRKAIIASDLPAFRQVLTHESNALLVPHEDVEAWANAVLRVTGDGHLRDQLSSQTVLGNARQTDWADIASKTLNVYGRCLQGDTRDRVGTL
jgi:glycosyltransferase involved in cell wall biosynthesis